MHLGIEWSQCIRRGQKDAVLVTNVLTDFYRAFPASKGHLIKPHLQRDAATHTLPALGTRGSHLGIETLWENFFCAGVWIWLQNPSFFFGARLCNGYRSRESGVARV